MPVKHSQGVALKGGWGGEGISQRGTGVWKKQMINPRIARPKKGKTKTALQQGYVWGEKKGGKKSF